MRSPLTLSALFWSPFVASIILDGAAEDVQEPSSLRLSTFLSDPSIEALSLEVVQYSLDVSRINYGNIFVSAVHTDLGNHRQHKRTLPGPHIFDAGGQLIWSAPSNGQTSVTATPCTFEASRDTHLCVRNAANGAVSILDSSYQEVAHYKHGDKSSTAVAGDYFKMLSGGWSFITTSHQAHPWDLTGFRGPREGHLSSACFQERRSRDGQTLFSWCSHDHIPMDETRNFLSTMGYQGSFYPGAGSLESPWNYFHITGVDKDDVGDYYVSAKHADTVYKIAGNNNTLHAPGEIVWRLGSARSSFQMYWGSPFSNQHDLRVRHVSQNLTILSLFDNAWTGAYNGHEGVKSGASSSAKILRLDTSEMIAVLHAGIISDPEARFSASHGNVGQLSNGNTWVGWGSIPFVSEYSATQEPVFRARLNEGVVEPTIAYEVHKQPWVGRPTSSPNVFAYTKGCDTKLVLYISWNGATEYRRWAIYTSASATRGFQKVATTDRNGFESVVFLDYVTASTAKFVMVKAIAWNGRRLGVSKATAVFVAKSQPECNEMRCPAGFAYNRASNNMGSCT